jgi:hypothetical protein
MARLKNEDLARLIGPRAKELGFYGDEGVARLAGLLSERLGVPVAGATVRSYLNGHRSPPAPVAIALCEELDISGADRAHVIELLTAHYRRRRAAQSASNRPLDSI